MSGTNWSEIINNRFVQFVVIVLLVIIGGVSAEGIFTNKPIKLWVIEFNRKDTAFKYITNFIHDTIYVPRYVPTQELASTREEEHKLSSRRPTNIQKIDNGSSGIQNNAPNYGTQVGGNINNYGMIPRLITEGHFLSFFKAFPDRRTRIGFGFYSPPDAEMLNVQGQMVKILRANGYANFIETPITMMGGNPPSNIIFEKQPDSTVVFFIPPNKIPAG